MKKYRLAFSILRAFVLLVGNPKRTGEVLLLATKMHRAGLYDPVIEHLKTDAQVSTLFNERFVRGRLDLSSFTKLRQGTLGHDFFNFVIRNSIDPNYFHDETRRIENDHDYYEVRLLETHDIWHVVLGFETDEIGEIGVQGFMIAQFSPPLSAFLVGGAFLRVLFLFPSRLFAYTSALSRGFQMGASCPQFMGIKWEECWAEETDALRRRLNVPFPEKTSPIMKGVRTCL